MKYCFVILHYLAIRETIECVESIERLYGEGDWNIVIVDNASRNETGKELREKYESAARITVLCLEENLGFAKGNNVGYDYAKEHFSPDFIIMINSDVVFKQKEFLREIERLYAEEEFDVLGPDILDVTEKTHTSPLAMSLRNVKEYKRSIKKQEIIIKSREKGGIWRLREILLDYLSRAVYSVKKNRMKVEDRSKKHYQCVLLGACFIFSPKFIASREHALNPETFLYHEEYILLYEMNCEKRKLVYSPSLWLVHKEGCSADLDKEATQKEIFKLREDIKSRKILLRMMTENGE